MAGGYWESQNKVRPGAYINFESNDQPLNALDARGPVIVPLKLNWGKSKEFVAIGSDTDFVSEFGNEMGDIVPVREAYKATGKIIVFNLNGGGDKAAGTDDSFTVTAVYGGTAGNNLRVTITKNLDDSRTVKTFYKGTQVDIQTVDDAEDLV